jgi:outer membrane protein assembly factor BamB/tetratricopeptide (TPR) repeat protein
MEPSRIFGQATVTFPSTSRWSLLVVTVLLGWVGIVLDLEDSSRTRYRGSALGQQPAEENPAESVTAEEQPDSAPTFSLLSPPREVLRLVEQSQALIAGKRYSEAFQRLQEVLQAPDDYFLPTEQPGHLGRSLKGEVIHLLRRLPPEAKDLYRVQFGSRAEKLLQEAVRSRKVDRVLEVAAWFPLTEAGEKATLLAAYWFLQEGAIPEATAQLEPLVQEAEFLRGELVGAHLLLAGCYLAVGRDAEAESVLLNLKSRLDGKPIRLGEQSIQWFGPEESPLQWFRRIFGSAGWPVAERQRSEHPALYYGFEPGRNGATDCGEPLLTAAWRVRVAEYPELEELIRQIERHDQSLGRASIPAAIPLVVGDIAVCRTLRGLIGVDLRTGKRRWETPSETAWELFLRSSSGISLEWLPLLEQAIRLRVWRDATAGGISSDGRLVFAVEGLGLPIEAEYPRLFLGARGSASLPAARDFNVLVAYELETGKRAWQFGGDGVTATEQQGKFFFLGAPLPVRGKLYVLGLSQGEIHLLELEAATGRLLWQAPLASVEESVSESVGRRVCGLSPAYDAGILVCPTGTGVIVGIDVLRRRLMWAFPYMPSVPKEQGLRSPFSARNFLLLSAQTGALAAGVPLIAKGKVIVTPPDVKKIFCLDLKTGRLLWQRPFVGLYVAAVHGNSVVVVEQDVVRFLALEAGLTAGKQEPARSSGESWTAGLRANLPAVQVKSGMPESPDGESLFAFRKAQDVRADTAAASGVQQSTEGMKAFGGREAPVSGVSLEVVSCEVEDQRRGSSGGQALQESVGSGPDGGMASASPQASGQGAGAGPQTENSVILGQVELPARSQVAGYGYRSGDVYFLPMNTGEIAEIDLMERRLKRVHRWASAVRLGNLVAADGRILSQSAGSLELFFDRRWLRRELQQRLAQTPQDPQGLYWIGQMHLQDGQFDQAIACFERLWQIRQTREVRESLRDAWLAALRADFSRFRGRIRDVEAILEEPEEKGEFWGLVAKGLEIQGDLPAAWDAYRQLIELDWNNPGWLRMQEGWQVRRSHWIQVQVQRLLEKAPEGLKKEITAYALQRLPAAGRGSGDRLETEIWERWLRYFFWVPEAGETALTLAKEYAANGSLLPAEYWLNRVIQEKNDAQRGRALALLLQMWSDNNRWLAVADWCRKLDPGQQGSGSEGSDWAGLEAESPPLREVIAQVRSRRELRAVLTSPADWPLGVSVRRDSQLAPSVFRPRVRLPWQVQSQDYVLARPDVFLSVGRPTLLGYDPFGKKLWEFSLADRTSSSPFAFQQGDSRLAGIGHTLVVSGRSELVALNTLSAGASATVGMLWGFDLVEMRPISLRGESESGEIGPRLVQEPARPGEPDLTLSAFVSDLEFSSAVRSIGVKYFAVKRRNNLAILDPLRGQVLWRRNDLPASSLMETTESRIFILDESNWEIWVLDADCGEVLNRIQLPKHLRPAYLARGYGGTESSPHSWCFDTALLCWEVAPQQDGQSPSGRLVLWDILEQRPIWNSPTIVGNFYCARQGLLLALWQQDGLLRIFRLPQETPLIEGKFGLPGNPEGARGLLLMVNSWQLVVLGYHRDWDRESSQRVFAPFGWQSEPIRQGLLWAFDWRGRPLWSEPLLVENQFFPLDQPSELPVLVFCCLTQSAAGGVARVGPELALLCVDRRTGTRVLDTRLPNPGGGMEIEGSPEEQVVRIRFPRSTLILSFTNAQVGTAGPSGDSGEGAGMLPQLWDLLRRATGQLLDQK